MMDESMNRWARLAKCDDDDAFDANERVETRREDNPRPATTTDRPTETSRRAAPRKASPVPVPKKYQKKYQ
jgi:hypothetical protein